MSTYLYLVCKDHDPPLFADSESGQHLYDLPQIREDIANRDAIVSLGHDVDYGHGFRNSTARFLRAHPKCEIAIQDEYGRWHPTTDTEGTDHE